MNIHEDKPGITCAALGNNAKKTYAIHIVNTGASRTANITGFPVGVKAITLYVTDKDHAVHKSENIKVENGKAKFHLNAVSYTTLVAK